MRLFPVNGKDVVEETASLPVLESRQGDGDAFSRACGGNFPHKVNAVFFYFEVAEENRTRVRPFFPHKYYLPVAYCSNGAVTENRFFC